MTANASPVLTGQSSQVAQAGGVNGPAAVQATPAYKTQKELSEKRQQLGKDMQELEMLNQMVSQAPLTVLFKGGRMDELGKRIDQTKKDIQGLEAVAATQPKEDVKAKRKCPDNAPPSDIEVDIGGTPEPEAAAQDAAREGEGDEIIKQLERGLPRWEGFADVGWAGDISSVSDPPLATALATVGPCTQSFAGAHD